MKKYFFALIIAVFAAFSALSAEAQKEPVSPVQDGEKKTAEQSAGHKAPAKKKKPAPSHPEADIRPSVQFKLESAEIKNLIHTPSPDEIAVNGSDPKRDIMVITYSFINADKTKKIDFKDELEFLLVDEFDNQYRKLERPADYDQPLKRVPKSFPSIYPEEQYFETIFFETPVKSAQHLTLHINTKNLGLPKDVSLNVPLTPAISPNVKKIQIVGPAPGATIIPGQIVHLKVDVNNPKAPTSIVVLSFDSSYRDSAPGKQNVYDLHVPKDQPSGNLSVSVIGNWDDEGLVVSDNILLTVQ